MKRIEKKALGQVSDRYYPNIILFLIMMHLGRHTSIFTINLDISGSVMSFTWTSN